MLVVICQGLDALPHVSRVRVIEVVYHGTVYT